MVLCKLYKTIFFPSNGNLRFTHQVRHSCMLSAGNYATETIRVNLIDWCQWREIVLALPQITKPVKTPCFSWFNRLFDVNECSSQETTKSYFKTSLSLRFLNLQVLSKLLEDPAHQRRQKGQRRQRKRKMECSVGLLISQHIVSADCHARVHFRSFCFSRL